MPTIDRRAHPHHLIEMAMDIAGDPDAKATERLAAMKFAHDLTKYVFVLFGDPPLEAAISSRRATESQTGG